MTFDEQIPARIMAQECRNQPLSAQVGVASVLKNRKLSGEWGHSWWEVCFYNHLNLSGKRVFQFSGMRGEDPNFKYAGGLRDDDPIIVHMLDILQSVLGAENDTTGGALFYHDKSIPTPDDWARRYEQCAAIGDFLFFKPKPVAEAVV